MKVRMLTDIIGYSYGDIVEAKRFRDLTPEEVSRETKYPERWNGNEIFVKRLSPIENGNEYLYMREHSFAFLPSEVRVIEE